MLASRDVAGSRDLAVVASNLYLLQLADTIRADLARAGVAMLFLKGTAYLDTLYPDPGARPMADVDFLIHPRDRSRVAHVLAKRDFVPDSPPAGREYSWQHHYNWAYRPRHAEQPLVEAHVGLCPDGRFAIDYDGLWRRARRYRVGGRVVPTLGPEDSLLYAAIHEAKHSFHSDHPTRREDIRRIIAVWRPHWQTVVTRARQWGVATAVWLVLSASARHGATVPGRVLDALRPSPLRATALDALVDVHGNGAARFPVRWRAVQLATTLATAEHAPGLARYLARYAVKRWRDWRRTAPDIAFKRSF